MLRRAVPSRVARRRRPRRTCDVRTFFATLSQMVGWHDATIGGGNCRGRRNALRRVGLAICVLVIVEPSVALGQSLAAIARREQARRDSVQQPGKVYTNEDLRSVPSSPLVDESATEAEDAEAPSTADAEPAEPRTASAPDSEDAEPARDEEYWRSRMGAVRTRLERNELFLDALESRVNALTTDFVNTDDPAQRALVALDRQKAQGELDRVQDEIDRLHEDIRSIEEEARRAGVPPGWLR